MSGTFLKAVYYTMNLLCAIAILWGTAEIVNAIFVGKDSFWWPKTGWDLFIYLAYAWLWTITPESIQKWKDKNPGRNPIAYLWDR